jgi:hypothetical protein
LPLVEVKSGRKLQHHDTAVSVTPMWQSLPYLSEKGP